MDGLFIFASLVTALVVLDLAAVIRGVDSRDGSSDPRSPVRPTGVTV